MDNNIVSLNASRNRWNEQNISIVQRMNRQQDCVEELIQRGYTILRSEIENGQPIIWIQPSIRAQDDLKGHLHIRKGGGSMEQTYQAQLLDCRVQWTMQGGHCA